MNSSRRFLSKLTLPFRAEGWRVVPLLIVLWVLFSLVWHLINDSTWWASVIKGFIFCMIYTITWTDNTEDQHVVYAPRVNEKAIRNHTERLNYQQVENETKIKYFKGQDQRRKMRIKLSIHPFHIQVAVPKLFIDEITIFTTRKNLS